MKRRALISLLISTATMAWADGPQVVAAHAEKSGMGWRISVTLSHPDTGWDHYAQGWEIVDATGRVLGTRELMHPHVTEQPFTRSLNAVILPDGVREIYIRTKCSVEGWTAPLYRLTLSPMGTEEAASGD
ncbi:hypothetical protein [Puniceibacterium sp. IMCC21224]|uniref:hypothetical protein n=1 Tax=Puniceibacterium sp. IMCC21224 TaxID=1618204 RepID=UPI00064DD900|nr:hypothetical protein [Puniceibacterium sp. IMCC21224]